MIFDSVGDITKNVRISASPIITCEGGREVVPIACRVRVKTITMRTNAVVIMIMLGARVKMVKSIKT